MWPECSEATSRAVGTGLDIQGPVITFHLLGQVLGHYTLPRSSRRLQEVICWSCHSCCERYGCCVSSGSPE